MALSFDYYLTQNMWQQSPAQFGQRLTMAMPPLQQGATMMNYVGQFPLSAMTPQQQMPQQQQPNQCSFPPFQDTSDGQGRVDVAINLMMMLLLTAASQPPPTTMHLQQRSS
jgi:hypothetical protein